MLSQTVYFLVFSLSLTVQSGYAQSDSMEPVSCNSQLSNNFSHSFGASQPFFQYLKVANEGFKARDENEIIEKTTFESCEPVWIYWSFANIPANTSAVFRITVTSNNGFNISYNGSADGGATGQGWWRYFYAFPSSDGTYLLPGDYNIKIFENESGVLTLKSNKNWLN